MKIGAKTWEYEKGIEELTEKADFLEVMAVEGKDYGWLKDIGIPIVIHGQHEVLGINNADKTKLAENMRSFNFAREVANFSGAKKIILHAGNKTGLGTLENTIEFFQSIQDQRVLIENLPFYHEFCRSPEEVWRVLMSTRKGFCLDINHAILGAIQVERDYMTEIRDFIRLGPRHYHLGGQKIDGDKYSEHLSFDESNLDVPGILKMIPPEAEITLETSAENGKKMQDLEYVRKVLKDNNL